MPDRLSPSAYPEVIVQEAIERLERANRGGEHLPLGAVEIALHDLKRLRMGQATPDAERLRAALVGASIVAGDGNVDPITRLARIATIASRALADIEPRTEQPSPKDSPEQREPATPEKCGTGRAPDQRPGADDEGETTGPSPDREAGVDQPSSPTSRYLPLADREPRSLPPSGSRTSDACIVCGGCGEPDEPCPGCGKEKIEAEPFIAPAASKGSQHTTKAKVAFTQDDLRHMRESLHCLATNAGNLVRRLRFEKREFDRAFEGLVLHQAESAIALWRETYEREVEQMAEVSPNTNQRMFTLLEYTEAAKKVRRETLEEAASLVEKLASGYASDSVRCRHVARELRALAAEGKR